MKSRSKSKILRPPNSSPLTGVVWNSLQVNSSNRVCLLYETILVFADKERPISSHIPHFLNQGIREEIPAQCCYSNSPSEQAGGQWSDAGGKQQLSINTDRGPGGERWYFHSDPSLRTIEKHTGPNYSPSCSQDGERPAARRLGDWFVCRSLTLSLTWLLAVSGAFFLSSSSTITVHNTT